MRGLGSGRRIRGFCPTLSAKLWKYSGHAQICRCGLAALLGSSGQRGYQAAKNRHEYCAIIACLLASSAKCAGRALSDLAQIGCNGDPTD